MLRLRTLLFRTPASRHESKRKHPTIAKITRAVLSIDEAGLYTLMHGKAVDVQTHREQTKPKGPYLQLAKMYYDDSAKKKITNPKCFVFCDCDDFKYRCEVALAIRGSSAVINSNGALPKFTNPNARPQVCKHLLAFLEKCVHYVNTNQPATYDKAPKPSKPDRELIEALRKPHKDKVNINRMFRNEQHGITGTRF